MSARSVPEAAVEAVAGALYAARYGGDVPGEDARAVAECWTFARADARAALAALVASAEVREGLRAAGCAVPVSDWRPSPLTEAILAALGGTEAT